jgi:hypothetical protein
MVTGRGAGRALLEAAELDAAVLEAADAGTAAGSEVELALLPMGLLKDPLYGSLLITFDAGGRSNCDGLAYELL